MTDNKGKMIVNRTESHGGNTDYKWHFICNQQIKDLKRGNNGLASESLEINSNKKTD